MYYIPTTVSLLSTPPNTHLTSPSDPLSLHFPSEKRDPHPLSNTVLANVRLSLEFDKSYK